MRLHVLAVLLCPVLGFANDQWTEVKSPHFAVVTDAGDKRGRDVALRFEQMRQVFGTLMLKGEVKTSRPVQILAFKNTKGIRPMAPLFKGKPIEVAGLYQKGQSEDFIALDLSTEGDYRWQTVFHEYAHLLLNSNTLQWPVWFDEGFAEFFSTIDLSGKQAMIGRAPESAAQILPNNRLVPVAQLFAVQHDSATYNESGDHRNMFYAESWLIVHYLYDKQLVKAAITSFLVSQGKPDEQEFRKNMGMGFAEFDRALQDYLRGNRLTGWNTPIPTGIDASSFATRQLNANEALIAVAEMHGAGLDHAKEALMELQQALSADPGNVKAKSDLGYAYFMQRDYEHAEPYLEQAASSGSNDPMVHTYYAMLLQKKFQMNEPSPEQLERQKRELEQAIALNPSLAEAYNLLSINAHQRHDSPAAIEAAARALALDRRNELYAVNLASAYLTAQKVPEAQAVIDQLRSSQNQQTLTAIASMQTYISQWQSYHQAGENYKRKTSEEPDAEEGTATPGGSPRVRLRVLNDSDNAPINSDRQPQHVLEGMLIQVDCNPDGSGSLYMEEGDHLVHLRFHSFSAITNSDASLSCTTKQKRATAEYTLGVVQKLSLSK